MELTAKRVDEVFRDCLFKEDEDKTNYVKAEGIVTNVGFHPDRLSNYKDEIRQMLDELPDTFKEKSGGGWSFLQACEDKHGNQWTGEHRSMEQLFLLGLAIGAVKCLLPRAVWAALPGGMPYYVILAQ